MKKNYELSISYYREPDNHIRDKVIKLLILDLSNYTTKKELGLAKGADAPNLAAEKKCCS